MSAVTSFRQYDNRGRIYYDIESGKTTSGASLATASVTYSGAEQSTISGGNTIYDSGALGIVIEDGAHTCTAVPSYGEYSTPASLAEALASGIDSGPCNGIVSALANGAVVTITALAPGTAFDYQIEDTGGHNTGFSTWSFSLADSGSGLTGGAGSSAGTVYFYQVPEGGYAPNGNILTHSDSVMGTWQFGYDTLNRLTTSQNEGATSASQAYSGMNGCWTYDGFGNRGTEAMSKTACTATPPLVSWARYSGTVNGANNNQMSATSQNANQASGYDGAGNVTNDGVNTYLYDAEGRICAVEYTVSGTTTMTGYLYDASGARVGKGSLSSWPTSCTGLITANGYAPTNQYLLGAGGEQVTELDGGNNWKHTNVWTGGKLLGTYDSTALHFPLTDPLGTKRIQVSAATGAIDETCLSLPYGDSLSCQGDDATEHHFTGKERDAESGNDYFGARYYASSMGRWMSPDWSAKYEPVPYAKLDNPQTLNLYAYVENNPLTRADSDGHSWNDVAQWVSVHVAAVGTQMQNVRREYNALKSQATSVAESDALKLTMRAKDSPLGRALANNAASDPARVAARAAKSDAQMAATITKGSAKADALANTAGVVGKGAAALAVGVAVYDVATAPAGQRGATAAAEAGGLAGAWAGGEAGAAGGAVVGSIFPGPGTAIGAAVGGIGGAIAGGMGGHAAGAEIYKAATTKAP
ncbi:MAG: RHS repeat-associated core domain-containing protein [Terracidiphilus sp.]|jgi:RHS repeat-associated protein